MPFKSESQRRLFYAKMNRGELSAKTIKHWEEHTSKEKKLPERVKQATLGELLPSFFDELERLEVKTAALNPALQSRLIEAGVGALGGGLLGGGIGALVNKENRGRGALVGAAVGAPIGIGGALLGSKLRRYFTSPPSPSETAEAMSSLGKRISGQKESLQETRFRIDEAKRRLASTPPAGEGYSLRDLYSRRLAEGRQYLKGLETDLASSLKQQSVGSKLLPHYFRIATAKRPFGGVFKSENLLGEKHTPRFWNLHAAGLRAQGYQG